MEALNQPDWQFAHHVERIWEPYRIKILYGGRGGIKSWTAADYHLIDGYQRPLRILCGREVQKSIQDSVHQLLADQIQRLGLGGFYEILRSEIRGINGTKFIFTGLSSLTAESIKSYEGVDRFWGEEAAGFTKRSLDILIPTIRKEGSELMFTMNPELDTDEIYKRYIENPDPDVLAIECSHYNNPWFPAVLEKERQLFLRQVESGARRQEEYDNIWEGKCKPAVDGAIYPLEIQKVIKDGRLLDVPYDPTLKVHLIWDLGWNDSMVILFVQVAAGAIRFIDFIEDNHRTYDSYVMEIKERQYNLGKAWLPHDGKSRNPQTGKSPIEILRALQLDVDEAGVPDIGINRGIDAARMMFRRCYFDKTKCTDLFNKLRRYARVISPTTGEAGHPKKDGNDHVADAFRYTAVIEKELNNDSNEMKPLKLSSQGIV